MPISVRGARVGWRWCQNGDNPTTRLQLTILAAVAQFERELMLERQREGIAAAKAAGKYRGRPPSIGKHVETIRAMRAAGEKPDQIAQKLGCSRSTVYELLKNAAPL
jgi:DNA invertase Pin-like site-specific DNA recombinase